MKLKCIMPGQPVQFFGKVLNYVHAETHGVELTLESTHVKAVSKKTGQTVLIPLSNIAQMEPYYAEERPGSAPEGNSKKK